MWTRRARRFWKDLAYRIGIRSLQTASLSLSDKRAEEVGRTLGRMAYRAAKSEAERARSQLAAAFPEKPPDEIADLAERCFENLGVCVVEILRFERINRANIAEYVEIDGREHLDAARENGGGFVALMAHFGNWELGAGSLPLYGYPVTALARTLRSKTLDATLNAQRERLGFRAISRDGSLREAVRALKGNEGLVVLADVDSDALDGEFVEFFGRLAHTPVAPVVWSQRYDAPALPVSLRRIDGLRHRLEVKPPMEWCDDLAENTRRFTRVIEDQVRAAPEQWIWMHPRWRTQPPTSLP